MKKRLKKKIEARRRAEIHKVVDLVLDINGLEERIQELTGLKLLRGSSTYDTKEMGILIDGLISECAEQGIETIPPDEFARMMEMYDRRWRKKHETDVQRFDG